MKCYAVIDTNVLVSALMSNRKDSATYKILEHLLNGEIIPIYSKEILQEYWDVLSRKKFGFSEKMVWILLCYIKQTGIVIQPQRLEEHLKDIDDLPFYEVVMDSREKECVLVTGNIKHFPECSYIITPRQLIDALENK